MSVPETPDSIKVIELNLGAANAINHAFLSYLNTELETLENTPKFTAGVITGYDRFFSAGLDLVGLYELDRKEMKAFMDEFINVFMRLFSCRKPVVAAINGHAIAGGCVLALACDFRVMGRGASLIGLNEVKLGIGLPSMVLEFARAVVSPHAFSQVLLLGETFQPQKALAINLIDDLVEPSSVRRRAIQMATELAGGGEAYSQIKHALRNPIAEKLKTDNNTEQWLDLWFSDDTRNEISQLRENLINKRSQREAKMAKQAAEEAQTETAETSEEQEKSADESTGEQPAQPAPRQKFVYEEPTEVLERISDEDLDEAAAAE